MLKYIILSAAALLLLQAPAMAAPILIKIAHGSPATDDKLEEAAQLMRQYVEEKSNGALKMVTYPAAQLGSERENLEGLQLGTIEMAILSTGPVPGIFPEIMLLDLPYIIPTEEVAYKIFDGPVGQQLAEKMLKKTGIHLLAYGENGFRAWSAKKDLITPDDFAGTKLRVMENPMYIEMTNRLNAMPVALPSGDVYTALAQGVVDGADQTVSAQISMRYYEVQSHMNLDNHVFNPHIVFTSDSFLSSLSPEHQQIIREGAAIFRDAERRINAEQTRTGLEMVRQRGIVVNELTPEQIAVLRERTQGVVDSLRKRIGAEVVDAYLAEVEKIKAELGVE